MEKTGGKREKQRRQDERAGGGRQSFLGAWKLGKTESTLSQPVSSFPCKHQLP